MKLYNIVVTYDVWIVAKSQADADRAAGEIITTGEKPFDQFSYEMHDAKDIPPRAHLLKPWLHSIVEAQAKKLGITDDDDVHAVYAKLNGKDP